MEALSVNLTDSQQHSSEASGGENTTKDMHRTPHAGCESLDDLLNSCLPDIPFTLLLSLNPNCLT